MRRAGKSNDQPFDFNRLIIELKAAEVGVKAALAEHKRRRQSVVIWKDGKVVELPPEDIPEPEK
ncbi:MAG: hypothetical protein QM758_23755 [Armatimonas sp.]